MVKKIVFIVGSTATGKSQWAIDLAKRYNSVIINCDSIQFYQGLTIGSAAPNDSQLKQVPHYLYSYVQAPAVMTAGQYIRDFYSLIENENLPEVVFVVGGTGFYLQALQKGMFNIPEIDLKYRTELEEEIKLNGSDKLFAELKSFDPESKIHTNDHYRLVRALEVKRALGKKMTDLLASEQNKNRLKIPYLQTGIWLEKPQLEENVRARTADMLRLGIIDEVQNFLKLGYEDWQPLYSVGYFEVLQYLRSQVKQDDLLPLICQSTMQLIKKQKTWFKRDESILWSNASASVKFGIEQKIDLFIQESS